MTEPTPAADLLTEAHRLHRRGPAVRMALIRACGRTRVCAYRSGTAQRAVGVGRGPDDEMRQSATLRRRVKAGQPGRRNTARPSRMVTIPRHHAHVYRGGGTARRCRLVLARGRPMPGYSAMSLGPGRWLAGPQ
jgi:hypothetical protein